MKRFALGFGVGIATGLALAATCTSVLVSASTVVFTIADVVERRCIIDRGVESHFEQL